jgi:hypothetical protein
MANQSNNVTFPPIGIVGAHQSIAVSTVQPVTLPANANGWYLQATGADVWIRFDGANPAVSGGFQLRAGDPPILFIAPNSGFYFNAIQASSGGILQVQPVSQPT